MKLKKGERQISKVIEKMRNHSPSFSKNSRAWSLKTHKKTKITIVNFSTREEQLIN